MFDEAVSHGERGEHSTTFLSSNPWQLGEEDESETTPPKPVNTGKKEIPHADFIPFGIKGIPLFSLLARGPRSSCAPEQYP